MKEKKYALLAAIGWIIITLPIVAIGFISRLLAYSFMAGWEFAEDLSRKGLDELEKVADE